MIKSTKKPLAVALGTAFLASAITPVASAGAVNPFVANELSSYEQVGEMGRKSEGSCGEGKCGEGKSKKEGSCGEGKCGDSKSKKEGSCGEGKCGGNK